MEAFSVDFKYVTFNLFTGGWGIYETKIYGYVSGTNGGFLSGT